MVTLDHDVKESILRLSAADLVRYVEVDFRVHTAEAVAFARSEMARRGITGSAQAASVQVGSGPAVRKPSRFQSFLGGVCVVMAIVSAYFAAVSIAIAITDGAWGTMAPALPVYAAVIGLLLWLGIKWQARWALFIAVPAAILAFFTLVAHLAMSFGATKDPREARSTLITFCIMAVLALVFFILGIAKRRRAVEASAS